MCSAKSDLINLANSFEKAYFERFPEVGMLWGRCDVSGFKDRSLSAYETWQKKEDGFLSALQKINSHELHDSPEMITYLLLKETLENTKATRICKTEMWDINPLFGWHNMLGIVAEKQPIGTMENRKVALESFGMVKEIVEEEINNLKKGLQEGYSAPLPVVKRVIDQLKIIWNSPLQNSVCFELIKRGTCDKFKGKMAFLIEEIINPSIKDYMKYLEEEYIPLCRKEIGISAIPEGEKCYRASLKKETTLDIGPEEVYEHGIKYIEKINEEIKSIGEKEWGISEVSEIFHKAKYDPTYLFQSEEEMLHYNQIALGNAKNKFSDWFDIMPMSEGVLKPFPLHRAQTGAVGEYHPPAIDGSRPGIFYINTYEPQKRSRVDQEATLFHELLPGHHLQIGLDYEDRTRHSLNKYLWNAGFGEGWALYAERLADEMGLYRDNISRLGMLSNEALRAARLVVDPGIHVMKWSREDAVAYLKKSTALDDNLIQFEVDRYSMLPGQAPAYMLGKCEIVSLREEAEEMLGNFFNIKRYHYQILENGCITLGMLRNKIEAWIRSEKN